MVSGYRFKTILLLLIFMFHGAASAAFLPAWVKDIKWPSDRVQDQVKLLPFAQELKLNLFLQKLKDREDLNLYFHFTSTLEGLDLKETTEKVLNEHLTSIGAEGSSAIIFFLSLSDRKFLIHATGPLKDELSGEDLSYLVKSVIPYLSQQKYSGAITAFISNLLFKVKGNNSYQIPELSLKKSYNLNTLLFFSVGALLIFMLGHKIRKNPKVLAKDPGLVKRKPSDLAIFW